MTLRKAVPLLCDGSEFELFHKVFLAEEKFTGMPPESSADEYVCDLSESVKGEWSH